MNVPLSNYEVASVNFGCTLSFRFAGHVVNSVPIFRALQRGSVVEDRRVSC